MSRTGVSQEQVFEAIEALQEDNQTVNIINVRARLGEGSYTTVSNHLKAWRAENDNTQAPVYPEIPETVSQAFQKVWIGAWKETQSSIQGEREGLALAQQQMTQELQDMGAEIARLEQENATQGEELKQAEQTLTEKEAALENAKKIVHGLEIDKAGLQEKFNAAQARATEWKTERDTLQTRLEAAIAKPAKRTPARKAPPKEAQ